MHECRQDVVARVAAACGRSSAAIRCIVVAAATVTDPRSVASPANWGSCDAISCLRGRIEVVAQGFWHTHHLTDGPEWKLPGEILNHIAATPFHEFIDYPIGLASYPILESRHPLGVKAPLTTRRRAV